MNEICTCFICFSEINELYENVIETFCCKNKMHRRCILKSFSFDSRNLTLCPLCRSTIKLEYYDSKILYCIKNSLILSGHDEYDRPEYTLNISMLLVKSICDYNLSLLNFIIENKDTDEWKCDINIFYNNKTPLMYASEKGYGNIINILLNNNANAKLKDTYGLNALDYACLNNNYICVKYIIQKIDFVDIDLVCPPSPDTFINSIISGNKRIYNLVLSKLYNINPNITYTNRKISPLIYASKNNRDLYIFKSLIKKGANVNITDIYGNNVLHHACLSNNLTTVEYINSTFPILITEKNIYGMNPLMICCKMGNFSSLEIILYSNNAYVHECLINDFSIKCIQRLKEKYNRESQIRCIDFIISKIINI